jgi:hypothetical protein
LLAKTVPEPQVRVRVHLGVPRARTSCSWPRTTASIRCARLKRTSDDQRWDAEAVFSLSKARHMPVDGATTAPVPVAVHFQYQNSAPACRPRPDRAGQGPCACRRTEEHRLTDVAAVDVSRCDGRARHSVHGGADSAWRRPWRQRRQARQTRQLLER